MAMGVRRHSVLTLVAVHMQSHPQSQSQAEPFFVKPVAIGDPFADQLTDQLTDQLDGPLADQLGAPQAIAMLSMHTSPVAAAGSGDGGGLNVYVRELSAAMAALGTRCDIYVRRTDASVPLHVDVAPGVRLTHIDAGPLHLAKEELPEFIDKFADGVAEHLAQRPVDAIHAHYWLSGVAGHRLKHELDVPLAVTFHTLGRVKSRNGDAEPDYRAIAEQQVMDCADAVFVSGEAETDQLHQLYDIAPERVRILTPGVNLETFSPGDRNTAQAALGLFEQTSPAEQNPPVILFVGRLQPLKGADIAVQALALARSTAARDAHLMIVGGPSGSDGDRTLADLHQLVADLGLTQRVIFVPPQPHHLLPTYYRAADICVVPSRSESFGLVALEAAACGVPVVASDVGGLSNNVSDGVTGLLAAQRTPAQFAAQIDRLLDDPVLALRLGSGGCVHASDHTWEAAAAAAAEVLASLTTRELVACV